MYKSFLKTLKYSLMNAQRKTSSFFVNSRADAGGSIHDVANGEADGEHQVSGLGAHDQNHFEPMTG